ncbi:MAG: YifB family Mg chelatase-like AAA ATPase [Kofleriaceae bacterium]
MQAIVASCTLVGIDAISVDVEVDLAGGIPSYHCVGLPAPSVKEGGVRIRAALERIGAGLPTQKITVNLPPADVRKVGAAFDLPIAVAILVASGVLDPAPVAGVMMLGELGLDGSVRAVRGALAAALLARARGLRALVVPEASAAEAACVDGLEVWVARDLAEVVAALRGEGAWRAAAPDRAPPAPTAPLDLAEVQGQPLARAALEIAVAGGHNLLLAGPPGIGKTMLARRVPTILPPLSRDDALEVTKIYSAAGLSDGLARARPFRAPHHTISSAALLGGGALPRPGEITLAHHGVLFLDELPEFSRAALEGLRQPLEDRQVVIGRAAGVLRLPASFLLVAAANPCPCGWLGARERACTCTLGAIDRYRARLSGPLLDRVDLHVPVRPVGLFELRQQAPAESSSAVAARVAEARARQAARLAPWGVATNAAMPVAAQRATCRLDAAGEAVLAELHARRRGLSARAIDRIIKVARTIADLVGQDDVDAGALREAASYRVLDLEPGAEVGASPRAS